MGFMNNTYLLYIPSDKSYGENKQGKEGDQRSLCEVVAFEQKPKRGRVLKIPKGNTFHAEKTIAMVP